MWIVVPVVVSIFLRSNFWSISFAIAHVLISIPVSYLIQSGSWSPVVETSTNDLIFFAFISSSVALGAVGLILWHQSLATKYATIVSGTFDGLVYSDSEGVIQELVGPLFGRRGFNKVAWIGRNESELICADDVSVTSVQSMEAQLSPEFADSFWVRVCRSDCPVSGGYVTSVQDINKEVLDRSKIYEISRLESLAQVCGGLAHDFNNLMTVIGIYAEMVENENLRDRFIEVQDKACRLTGGLLAFARIDTPQSQTICLVESLDSLQQVIESFVPANINVCRSLQVESANISFDPAQLRLLILNLLRNAVDAMPAGGTLQIKVDRKNLSKQQADRRSVRAGEFVCLDVVDNGAGMAEDVRRRATEPFFTTKPRGEATGIGLSTVHGTVVRSGGTLSIESQVGQGTEIRIMFPSVEVEQEDRNVPRSNVPAAPENGTIRVILVEDREELREAIEANLSARGIEVASFETAESAYQFFSDQTQIDAIITDIMLPGISGIDLLGLIREESDVPVILMSGYHLENTAEIVSRDPRCQFINKPFMIDELLTEVRKLIDKAATGNG